MLSSSFVGKEVKENTVTWDSEVDHEDAFNMFMEFLYISSYSPSEGYDVSTKATLHARVYLLAERLCMNELKEMAFVRMTRTLVDSYQPQYAGGSGFVLSGFVPSDSKLDPSNLIDLVHLIYHGTTHTVPRWQEPGLTTISSKLTDEALKQEPPSAVATVGPPDQGYPAEEDPTERNPIGETPADALIDAPVGTSVIGKPPTGGAENPPDKLRALIARYAASSLDDLRENAGFAKLLQDGGDFVVDLVTALTPGPNIRNFVIM